MAIAKRLVRNNSRRKHAFPTNTAAFCDGGGSHVAKATSIPFHRRASEMFQRISNEPGTNDQKFLDAVPPFCPLPFPPKVSVDFIMEALDDLRICARSYDTGTNLLAIHDEKLNISLGTIESEPPVLELEVSFIASQISGETASDSYSCDFETPGNCFSPETPEIDELAVQVATDVALSTTVTAEALIPHMHRVNLYVSPAVSKIGACINCIPPPITPNLIYQQTPSNQALMLSPRYFEFNVASKLMMQKVLAYYKASIDKGWEQTLEVTNDSHQRNLESLKMDHDEALKAQSFRFYTEQMQSTQEVYYLQEKIEALKRDVANARDALDEARSKSDRTKEQLRETKCEVSSTSEQVRLLEQQCCCYESKAKNAQNELRTLRQDYVALLKTRGVYPQSISCEAAMKLNQWNTDFDRRLIQITKKESVNLRSAIRQSQYKSMSIKKYAASAETSYKQKLNQRIEEAQYTATAQNRIKKYLLATNSVLQSHLKDHDTTKELKDLLEKCRSEKEHSQAIVSNTLKTVHKLELQKLENEQILQRRVSSLEQRLEATTSELNEWRERARDLEGGTWLRNGSLAEAMEKIEDARSALGLYQTFYQHLYDEHIALNASTKRLEACLEEWCANQQETSTTIDLATGMATAKECPGWPIFVEESHTNGCAKPLRERMLEKAVRERGEITSFRPSVVNENDEIGISSLQAPTSTAGINPEKKPICQRRPRGLASAQAGNEGRSSHFTKDTDITEKNAVKISIDLEGDLPVKMCKDPNTPRLPEFVQSPASDPCTTISGQSSDESTSGPSSPLARTYPLDNMPRHSSTQKETRTVAEQNTDEDIDEVHWEERNYRDKGVAGKGLGKHAPGIKRRYLAALWHSMFG